MTEQKFYSLVNSIENEALRVAVEDSAVANARDTWVDDGRSWTYEGPEYWKVAIATAEMILVCPRDYYPELFAG